VWTSRITEFPPQPGEGVLQQVGRPLASLAALSSAWIIAAQQLHQSGGGLLGSSPRHLGLGGVPFTIPDRQPMQQLLG
jgi:hypothetical protein